MDRKLTVQFEYTPNANNTIYEITTVITLDGNTRVFRVYRGKRRFIDEPRLYLKIVHPRMSRITLFTPGSTRWVIHEPEWAMLEKTLFRQTDLGNNPIYSNVFYPAMMEYLKHCDEDILLKWPTGMNTYYQNIKWGPPLGNIDATGYGYCGGITRNGEWSNVPKTHIDENSGKWIDTQHEYLGRELFEEIPDHTL